MANSQKNRPHHGCHQRHRPRAGQAFAQDHYHLVLVARSQDELAQTATELRQHGGQGTTIAKDLFARNVREEEETEETGVTITILEPGVTDTDFFNKADMERAKLVAEGPKADPAKGAQDGYDALMAGKDKIISGLLNKAQAVHGRVLPDGTAAAIMHKQAEPVDGNESAR